MSMPSLHLLTILILSTTAAAQLTPCTLELGGKSPAYIDASGDLEVSDDKYGDDKNTNFTSVESEKTAVGQV